MTDCLPARTTQYTRLGIVYKLDSKTLATPYLWCI